MTDTKQVDKTIYESAPSISKIILIEGGRGGLKVKYNIGQTINGVLNNKKRQEEVNRPVQKEIRDGFDSLKLHLLKGVGIATINDKIEQAYLAKTVVTTIVVDKKDQIQVSGYLLSGGTHHAAIATPFLTADYYGDFANLESIIDSICEESKLFMSGTKSANLRTIVTDFMVIKKDITNAEEAYSKMSEAELNEITREALAESGLRIIMEDGVEVIAPMEEEHDNQISMAIDESEEAAEEVAVVSEIEEPAFEDVISEAPETGLSDDELFID